MVKFFRLTFLRSIERFVAQWISVSTERDAFVRERIRLGDTTNFLKAANFFLYADSTAFLAEVATLRLLGIGNLTEPFYWLFMLLTAIPSMLICFSKERPPAITRRAGRSTNAHMQTDETNMSTI
jgi:hypothetical protein